MRFGLIVSKQHPPGVSMVDRFREHIEQVHIARDTGFDAVVVGQHFLSEPYQELHTMILLSRLAAEVGTMRLGPCVLLLPLLNPVVVAEETATLDWLTGGKAIIGLGLGYRKEEFDSIGIPFKERVPRFVEAVELIRKLWRDDTVEHRGRFHTVTGVLASLKPSRPSLRPLRQIPAPDCRNEKRVRARLTSMRLAAERGLDCFGRVAPRTAGYLTRRTFAPNSAMP